MRTRLPRTLYFTLVLVLFGFMPLPTNADSKVNIFSFFKVIFQPKLDQRNTETGRNNHFQKNATAEAMNTATVTESKNYNKQSLNETKQINESESATSSSHHIMRQAENQTNRKNQQLHRQIPRVLDVRRALLSASSSSLGETCINIGVGCDGFVRADDVMLVFNNKGSRPLFQYPNLHSNDQSEWSIAVLNGQTAYHAGIIPTMSTPRRQPSSPVMELPAELKYLHDSILWQSDFCIFQSTYVERDPYQSLAPPSDLRQIGCTRSPTLSFL